MHSLSNKIGKLFGFGKNVNINQSTRKRQLLYGTFFLIAILIFFLGFKHLATKPVQNNIQLKKEVGDVLDGVLSTDFTEKDTKSAQEIQQHQIDELMNQLEEVKKITLSLDDERKQREKDIEIVKEKFDQNMTGLKIKEETVQPSRMISKVKNKSNVTEKMKLENTSDLYEGVEMKIQNPPMETLSFSYDDFNDNRKKNILKSKEAQNNKKNTKNWVPAGTFVRGVLLEGADANASVNGQSDTVPILVRLLDQGTLPNGKESHLEGCFVLASIYGDISSERGEARLNTLSCTRKDGTILEVPVQGHLSFAGKEGIKGKPIMRNGKILAMAGMSGTLSGVGGALQQSAQSITTSPFGTLATVSGSQIWENGAYGGASTAMGQLAHYYIQRANQYHPIISIGSGTVATVIFQSGFSLTDKNESMSDSDEEPSQSQKVDNSEMQKLIESSKIKKTKNKDDDPFVGI